jgi:hypothetical protein
MSIIAWIVLALIAGFIASKIVNKAGNSFDGFCGTWIHSDVGISVSKSASNAPRGLPFLNQLSCVLGRQSAEQAKGGCCRNGRVSILNPGSLSITVPDGGPLAVPHQLCSAETL